MLLASFALIPTQVAQAQNGTFEKTLKEEGDCFTNGKVTIKLTVSQTCHFQIVYSGPEAVITDTVPAEWEVVSDIMDNIDNKQCTSTVKKPGKSATKIDCGAQTDITIMVWLETRESPDTKKNGSPHDEKDPKFKPTSCDRLFVVNDGAVATATELFEGEPVFVVTSNDLTINAEDPDDLNCNGIPDSDEV